MSPKDAAIASFGKNNDRKYCVRIHSTTGDGNVSHQCFSEPIDCAWAPNISKIAVSYSDMSYECIPTEAFAQSGPLHGHYAQSSASRYVLSGRDEHPEKTKIIPVVAVLHHDGDDAEVLKRIPLKQGTDYHCATQVAFVGEKQIAVFVKNRKRQRLSLVNWLDETSDYLSDITAVDFSCKNPVAGTMYGQVFGGIYYDNKNVRSKWDQHVFEDHSAVTLLSACNNAIAAVAGKTIKVLSSQEVLATYQHEGEDIPSIIKIASDGSKFAYAAGKALHIMLCEPGKIEKLRHYVFDKLIIWMHYGRDDSIYVAHGGSLLKILP